MSSITVSQSPRVLGPAAMEVDSSAPFPSAEAAWLWAWRAFARQGKTASSPRAGTPDDVVKCLDRLYRKRSIHLAHVRIMRIYGERGEAPSARTHAPVQDVRLWAEAMAAMDFPLRAVGIVR